MHLAKFSQCLTHSSWFLYVCSYFKSKSERNISPQIILSIANFVKLIKFKQFYWNDAFVFSIEVMRLCWEITFAIHSLSKCLHYRVWALLFSLSLSQFSYVLLSSCTTIVFRIAFTFLGDDAFHVNLSTPFPYACFRYICMNMCDKWFSNKSPTTHNIQINFTGNVNPFFVCEWFKMNARLSVGVHTMNLIFMHFGWLCLCHHHWRQHDIVSMGILCKCFFFCGFFLFFFRMFSASSFYRLLLFFDTR